MITIRHCLSPEGLALASVRVLEAFACAGLEFDALEVKFEEAEQETADFSEKLSTLVLSHFPERRELLNLKTTAWERANPNAPFWRKLQRRKR